MAGVMASILDVLFQTILSDGYRRIYAIDRSFCPPERQMLDAACSKRKIMEAKMSEVFLMEEEYNHRAYRCFARDDRRLIFALLYMRLHEILD